MNEHEFRLLEEFGKSRAPTPVRMKENKTPSIADMQRHIDELAARHEILLDTRRVKRTERAYALRAAEFPAADEVQTPPIRSAVTYAVALHEIGHILGRYQTSRAITRTGEHPP